MGLNEKSVENWEAGDLLFSKKLLNAAASRFYYSVFEVVTSYATSRKELDESYCGEGSHKRVLDYVRQDKKLPPNFSKNFTKLKAMRIKADYEEENVGEWELTHNFLKHVKDVRDYYGK